MPPASAAVGGLRRFFDISVPRNIAPEISEGVGGRVFNVDDLKEVVSRNKEERRKAAEEACVLLDQEQLAFEAWRDSLETVPTIKVRPILVTVRESHPLHQACRRSAAAGLLLLCLVRCCGT